MFSHTPGGPPVRRRYDRSTVEELGAGSRTERVEALPKCLLQFIQGEHRANDRFEDLRSAAEKPSLHPSGRGGS
jgi:hypothetical protein